MKNLRTVADVAESNQAPSAYEYYSTALPLHHAARQVHCYKKPSHEIIVPTPNKRLHERKSYIPDGENATVIYCDISVLDINVYVAGCIKKRA